MRVSRATTLPLAAAWMATSNRFWLSCSFNLATRRRPRCWALSLHRQEQKGSVMNSGILMGRTSDISAQGCFSGACYYTLNGLQPCVGQQKGYQASHWLCHQATRQLLMFTPADLSTSLGFHVMACCPDAMLSVAPNHSIRLGSTGAGPRPCMGQPIKTSCLLPCTWTPLHAGPHSRVAHHHYDNHPNTNTNNVKWCCNDACYCVAVKDGELPGTQP